MPGRWGDGQNNSLGGENGCLNLRWGRDRRRATSLLGEVTESEAAEVVVPADGALGGSSASPFGVKILAVLTD